VKKHIHILGASGSGTTTIAGAVANRLGYRHFDSDSYFWAPSAEPFTLHRDREERVTLLEKDLNSYENWVLSGSLADWGNSVIPHFDLVVFVTVPQEIRMERLKKREYERYGKMILPGGSRYDNSEAFLAWAESYDDGGLEIRSFQSHEVWLKRLLCPLLRIENLVLEESVTEVVNAAETL